jgi:methyl-accepting chemotaxis protein
LADQSKEATQQVRSILDDTRNWVGAVVLATEQGGKAVESGLSQAMAAGESIEALTARVVDSSRAASVIVESIRQQFAGIDEVAGTMAHIDKRVRQNLSGMSQLQSSAKSLDDLSEALKHIAERYKI